jgi:hypothetical protein
MPKIYKYLGFYVSFFVNEHLPIHIHIKRGEREIKAEFHYINGELKITYKKTKSTPLRSDEIAEIEPFLRKYHKKIADKWKQVFILDEPVRMEEVRKKIK